MMESGNWGDGRGLGEEEMTVINGVDWRVLITFPGKRLRSVLC
jgi:hypothetical protein